MKILEYIGKDNIAGDLDKDLLVTIGSRVCEEYAADKESCSDWRENIKEAIGLARQIKDGRTYAGENASDVKYPIIASAAIQYAARAYPAIVRNDEVVKGKVIGDDPKGEKAAKGKRVSEHMNHQIIEQMDGWEDDMDKLLVRHAIVGDYFKKTYYDPIKGKNCSDIVNPEDLVMYYYADSPDKAPRKTHTLEFSHNRYIEMVRSDIFEDIELEKPESKSTGDDKESNDETHTFLEQHRLWDLDDDGYEEPYVVTVHEETQQVVRIVARYAERNIILNSREEIARIEPIEYFTSFPFMPSFDGGVYGMGFGILLSPINHSINSLFNMLLDAGKRANFQGGFLGKGVKLLRGGNAGTIRFKAGEWKQVGSYGDDLRKNIVPLPLTDPSAVLFQLLGLLLEASRELASQSELLSGQQAQHNVPATTTLALIEQGLKVFSAVYKRVYRGLKKEFHKLFDLNAAYLDERIYSAILDDPKATRADYALDTFDIAPVSTSATVSDTQKYVKAQAMRELKGQGLNDREIDKFYIESLEVPDAERFLPKEAPPPDPKMVIEQGKLELDMRKQALEEQKFLFSTGKVREEMVKLRAESIKLLAEAEAQELGPQMEIYKSQIDSLTKTLTEMDKTMQGAANAGTNGGRMGGAQGVSSSGQNAQTAPQGA